MTRYGPSSYKCEDFKHVHYRKCRERCDQIARWYVVSGPMYVCWNHKRHQEAQREVCLPLANGGAA